ncbi:hypothetical protein BHE74_00055709 [Ensete ventricosum]|nr:hypothetical protein BHE74_00055709 [Ensete ventricosum]
MLGRCFLLPLLFSFFLLLFGFTLLYWDIRIRIKHPIRFAPTSRLILRAPVRFPPQETGFLAFLLIPLDMSSSSLLLLLLFFLLHLPPLFLPTLAADHVESPASPSNGTTVYDLLPQYGLPPGVLPDTVKSFSLASNGQFVVELYGPCYVDFEYLVYYAPRVSGVIKYGGIESLEGVQVRRFMVWFDVGGIMVDVPSSEFIYFHVGWITRKLRIEQFQTVHSCRGSLSLLGRAKEVARSVLEVMSLCVCVCVRVKNGSLQHDTKFVCS